MGWSHLRVVQDFAAGGEHAGVAGELQSILSALAGSSGAGASSDAVVTAAAARSVDSAAGDSKLPLSIRLATMAMHAHKFLEEYAAHACDGPPTAVAPAKMRTEGSIDAAEALSPSDCAKAPTQVAEPAVSPVLGAWLRRIAYLIHWVPRLQWLACDALAKHVGMAQHSAKLPCRGVNVDDLADAAVARGLRAEPCAWRARPRAVLPHPIRRRLDCATRAARACAT